MRFLNNLYYDFLEFLINKRLTSVYIILQYFFKEQNFSRNHREMWEFLNNLPNLTLPLGYAFSSLPTELSDRLWIPSTHYEKLIDENDGIRFEEISNKATIWIYFDINDTTLYTKNKVSCINIYWFTAVSRTTVSTTEFLWKPETGWVKVQ